MKMKADEIYNTTISVYKRITDGDCIQMTLKDTIKLMVDDGMKTTQEFVRQFVNDHAKMQDAKRANVPVIVAQAVIKGQRIEPNVIKWNNLYYVDIDIKPNKGENAHLTDPLILADTRARIFNDPSCVYVNTSISGNGLCALMAIDDVTKIDTIFPALAEHFMQKYNVTIDNACKDKVRGRYIALYDGQGQFKRENCEIIPFNKHVTINQVPIINEHANINKHVNESSMFDDDKLCEALIRLCNDNNLIDTTEYTSWLHVCWACVAINNYDLFDEISRNCGGDYSRVKVQKQYNACAKVFNGDRGKFAYYAYLLKEKYGKYWAKIVKNYKAKM